MLLVPISLPTSPGLFDPASGGELGEGPRTDAACGDDFGWAYNSVGTSPCLIAAEVLGACNESNWYLPGLHDDMSYPPPNVTTANSCFCSWSAYNLLSACLACQGHEKAVSDWAPYQTGCSLLQLTDAYFPETVLSPVLIPHWAALNPSLSYNHRFNVMQARIHASQDFDDLVPKSSNWRSSLPPTRTSSTVGITIGVIGLLGGLAGITFAIDLVLYMIYRQRKRRSEDHRNSIGRRELNAIALTPPPSRRPAHTTHPSRDASAPERTRRLESTPIFI